MPRVIQKGRKPKTKCFTIKTGKVVCQDSKGAKKNFNQKKIKQKRQRGKRKGEPSERRCRYDKKTAPP